MKTLYRVINRKNVILHMTLWGLFSGALLGAGYILLYTLFTLLPVLFSLLSGAAGVPYESDMYVPDWYPLMSVFGLVIGGIAGMLMGIANGILMGIARQSRHLTWERKKRIGYCINVAVALVTMWLLILVTGEISWFFIGAPSIIALGASLLATERHFNLLAQIDARKPKAKRDAAPAA